MSDYTLYQGDCLDILPTLEAGSVDAIICDPPYGTTACHWDAVIPFDPMWREIKRVLKPRGACVLFGSEPFASRLRLSNLPWYKYDWVWEKSIAGDFLNTHKPLKAHEIIMVFSDGSVANRAHALMSYYPQIDTTQPAWKKKNGKMAIGTAYHAHKRAFIEGEERGRSGRLPRSVLHFANPNHDNVHPTQKPLPLMRYLVRTYTNAGETVLDFTMGSGTTGEACILERRSFIGIEKDPAYFAIAENRITTAANNRQMTLEELM